MAKTLELAGVWPRVMFKAFRRSGQDSCFAGYKPTGHDVFACAGFKSGTTWLLQIAVQIAYLGQAEFDNIHSVVAWPDAHSPFRRRIIPLADDSPVRRAPTQLRIVKTHLQQQLVPYSSKARYMVMVRDPKDVIVSGYHFIRSLLLGPLMPTVRHWVELSLSGELPSGSWARHLDSYWRMRNEPNVLFLTYEDLSANPDGAVQQIARFMNVDLEPGQLEAVTRAVTFEEMRTWRNKFDPGRVVPWGKAHSMLRKGRPGEAAELLSSELRQLIDDHSRMELRRLNCDFPYDLAYVKGQSVLPICGGH
ncbi:MAG: sulfotransferase domain-containing protein [Steroidobacteraceae bacterium]